MNRRKLLSGALAAGAAGAMLRLPIVHAADAGDSDSRLLVFVHAAGGWDPTCFCDPKTNVTDAPKISRWADNTDSPIVTAGGVSYANVGNNAAFFDKHHRRLLVVNGIDVQTNSHDVGTTHMGSGTNTGRQPSLTALFAGRHGHDLPMSYISFGGYSSTVGTTVPAVRVGDPEGFAELGNPLSRLHPQPHREFMHSAVVAKAAVAAERPAGMLPSEHRSRRSFEKAMRSDELRAFVETMPELDYDGPMRPQAQVAIHAFKSGLSVSADLPASNGDFDTHSDHDGSHVTALNALTDGINSLWDYAEAAGIAHRLTVVVASEMGRTNYYNNALGKDHWPITSMLVMEDGASWTGRVVGETDEFHMSRNRPIDPTTLAVDERNGSIIYPRHVHKALRRHLGIAVDAVADRFRFDGVADFAFFG